MTGEEFYKYHWRAMELVMVHWPRLVNYKNVMTAHPEKKVEGEYSKILQCYLLAVDFNCHTMRLIPVKDIGDEEKEFWISIELVYKSAKLKLNKKPCQYEKTISD